MAEPSHWKDQPLRLPASSLALRKPGNWLAGCFCSSKAQGEAVPDVLGEALNVDHVGRSALDLFQAGSGEAGPTQRHQIDSGTD